MFIHSSHALKKILVDVLPLSVDDPALSSWTRNKKHVTEAFDFPNVKLYALLNYTNKEFWITLLI